MQITDLLESRYSKSAQVLNEGGNARVGKHEAQKIDLKKFARQPTSFKIWKILDEIDKLYHKTQGNYLWGPELLKSKKFLSGSSFHFFNPKIDDEKFTNVKPMVGDIDTQVDRLKKDLLAQFLLGSQNKKIGGAKLLGFNDEGNQLISLWELSDPPIKVQVDFELVDYYEGSPTEWARFSHSSAWEDLEAGIKGVFHKFVLRAITAIRARPRYIQKPRSTKYTDASDLSFSVDYGLREKYKPVVNDKGRPVMFDDGANGSHPVYTEIPVKDSKYVNSLKGIFEIVFGAKPKNIEIEKLNSFKGTLALVNQFYDSESKQKVLNAFIRILFGDGAQGLYRNDPETDRKEKMVALNTMIVDLGLQTYFNTVKKDVNKTIKEYYGRYKVETPVAEQMLDEETPAVVASKRKGIVHLEKMKDLDFLELLEELKDQSGSKFTLDNVSMNVKIDGMGGRFGKDAKGVPFYESSSSGPIQKSGAFTAYAQEKGLTEPVQLERARHYDKLYEQVMALIPRIDAAYGKDFLKNVKVHCEFLYAPMAVEEEGNLKFVNIAYDKLPKGVTLALVPLFAESASTGDELNKSNSIRQKLIDLGKLGPTMFVDNRLTRRGKVDVTAVIKPLKNIDALKDMIKSNKRLAKKEASAAIQPIKEALAKAIIDHPNIMGRDRLGKDYEGIILNTSKGPVKITTPYFKDIMAKKVDQQRAQSAEQPRTNTNKTAVVAVGSFVGHKGHEELWQYTLQKAQAVGGDPYLFIGNAVGKDDPIPPDVKVETWHKMYPKYKNNISTVIEGGTLLQKIKHELINPRPGLPPRYDHIIIMVGEDQKELPMAAALMKAVNKFAGYEHVKVDLEPTPRGTGMSFTKLRNTLKDKTLSNSDKLAVWKQGFDVDKLGEPWIKHLMSVTKNGMGIKENLYHHLKDLDEGGWSVAATQGTVITPSVIKKTLEIVKKQFLPDLNKYLKKEKLGRVKMGHPTGSSAHYAADPEHVIYGDLDLQIIVPEVEGKETSGQLQSFWQKKVADFIKANEPNLSYMHPENSKLLQKPLIKLDDEHYIQIDLMPHTEKGSEWGRYRVTAERGLKGIMSGNLYWVLGDMFNFSIQHIGGLQYKTVDGKKIKFGDKIKTAKVNTAGEDIKTFILDLFKHEVEMIKPTKVKIDPMLKANPGIKVEKDLEKLRVSPQVRGIIGLAKSFEASGMYGKGDLEPYANAQEFLNEYLKKYMYKAQVAIDNKKRDKAETEHDVARAKKDREEFSKGSQYIRYLFQNNGEGLPYREWKQQAVTESVRSQFKNLLAHFRKLRSRE